MTATDRLTAKLRAADVDDRARTLLAHVLGWPGGQLAELRSTGERVLARRPDQADYDSLGTPRELSRAVTAACQAAGLDENEETYVGILAGRALGWC